MNKTICYKNTKIRLFQFALVQRGPTEKILPPKHYTEFRKPFRTANELTTKKKRADVK
jgi:hypothetical protein